MLNQIPWNWHTILYFVLALGMGWAYMEKRYPVLVKKVLDKIPQPERTIIEDTGNLLASIEQSPFMAGIAAKEKVQVKHVLSELQRLNFVNEAKTVLLSVYSETKKVYSELSPAEQVNAEYLVRLALTKFGVQLTDKQIQGIIDSAVKDIEALKSQATFKAAFVKPAEPAQPQQTA